MRTLDGLKFSTWLANRLLIEALFKDGLIEKEAAEQEVLKCYEAMDRMISGECD